MSYLAALGVFVPACGGGRLFRDLDPAGHRSPPRRGRRRKFKPSRTSHLLRRDR